MREYKFRAWDKVNREMYYQSDTWRFEDTSDGLDSYDLVFPFYDTSEYGDINKFELMQYIGLQDINKKDIFENDICNYYGAYSWGREEVKFKDGSYTLGKFMLSEEFIKKYEVEVIGNIFENPELLKEKSSNEQ